MNSPQGFKQKLVPANRSAILGAIIAAFIIGIIEAVGLTLIGERIHVYMFSIFIIVLIFRPRGLYGHA